MLGMLDYPSIRQPQHLPEYQVRVLQWHRGSYPQLCPDEQPAELRPGPEVFLTLVFFSGALRCLPTRDFPSQTYPGTHT